MKPFGALNTECHWLGTKSRRISHGFLSVNDDPSIKHVRMACRDQILTGVDVGLRALGVCLVGPIVESSPA